MDRLHRRDDVQLREAGDVIRVQDLRVLDAVAQMQPLASPAARLQHIQHHAVGPVADRVRDHRQPRIRGPADNIRHLLGAGDRYAEIARFAIVGSQHPGRARPERAIAEHLHPADAQEFIALILSAAPGGWRCPVQPLGSVRPCAA